jgi:hypothetical protein
MVKKFIVFLVIALFSSLSYANQLSVANESLSNKNNAANNRLKKIQQEIYSVNSAQAVNNGNIKEESYEFMAVEVSIACFAILFTLVSASAAIFGFFSVKRTVLEKTETHIEEWIKKNSKSVFDNLNNQLDDNKKKLENKIVLMYKEVSSGLVFAADNDYTLTSSTKESVHEGENNPPYSRGEKETKNKSVNPSREGLSEDE